jgi:hypothetical protein
MYDSDATPQSIKLQVELDLDGGLRLVGNVFVSQKRRLSDLLNDDAAFVPFETSEGLITILRKSTIRRVTPSNQVSLPVTATDPYEILGVSPNIADDDLKTVYHRRVQETHPDRLVAMGMPPEFVHLATDKLARINDAFERITQLRQAKAAIQPKWYPGG